MLEVRPTDFRLETQIDGQYISTSHQSVRILPDWCLQVRNMEKILSRVTPLKNAADLCSCKKLRCFRVDMQLLKVFLGSKCTNSLLFLQAHTHLNVTKAFQNNIFAVYYGPETQHFFSCLCIFSLHFHSVSNVVTFDPQTKKS